MHMNEYQRRSAKTAIYPGIGSNFVYPALGLCGEAGEVAEKIKKIIRDKNGVADETDIEGIRQELGDVLWYLARLADEFRLRLADIAEDNIQKLYDRQARERLHGSGDKR